MLEFQQRVWCSPRLFPHVVFPTSVFVFPAWVDGRVGELRPCKLLHSSEAFCCQIPCTRSHAVLSISILTLSLFSLGLFLQT
jgi:hypothetical protein